MRRYVLLHHKRFHGLCTPFQMLRTAMCGLVPEVLDWLCESQIDHYFEYQRNNGGIQCYLVIKNVDDVLLFRMQTGLRGSAWHISA